MTVWRETVVRELRAGDRVRLAGGRRALAVLAARPLRRRVELRLAGSRAARFGSFLIRLRRLERCRRRARP